MTDRNKFEEMLERLVNEDRAGAEELFHEIVVEKSREIYQAIIESEEEDDDDDIEESQEEDLDEAEDEDDEDEKVDESEDDDLDEMFGLDEFEMEADPMADMGGDATDDMMGDIEMDTDDMGGNSEPATKDDIMDLSDALEELKAEFQALMADEGDEMDMDDLGDEDEGDEEEDEGDEDEGDEEMPNKESFAPAFEAKHDKDKKEKKSATEQMREYVEKIAPAKMGDNGSNAKSIVASKNDMGGSSANILRTDTENGVEANKGHLKGSSLFKGTPKEDNAGNINVPGGKAGKTAFKKSEPGHGAEKKGKPEVADKGAGSLIKTAVRNN